MPLANIDLEESLTNEVAANASGTTGNRPGLGAGENSHVKSTITGKEMSCLD